MEALVIGYGSDDSSSDSETTTLSIDAPQPPSLSTIKPSLALSPSPSPPSPSSPSSSQRRSPPPKTTPGKKYKEEHKQSDSLTGLLSAYSHADENGNDDELDTDVATDSTDINNRKRKIRHAEDAPNDKTRSTGKEENAEITNGTPKRRRRRRRWDNAEGVLNVDDSSCNEAVGGEANLIMPPILPRPRLSGDNDTPFDALILFPKDYITPFSCYWRRQATTVTQNNGTTLTGKPKTRRKG